MREIIKIGLSRNAFNVLVTIEDGTETCTVQEHEAIAMGFDRTDLINAAEDQRNRESDDRESDTDWFSVMRILRAL